jgi:hypothetical protein
MPPNRDRKPSAPQPPQKEQLPADLRRDDEPAVAGEEIPSPVEDTEREDPVDVHSPSEDGGVEQHPIHDDDPDDDFGPEDYEEQLDEADKAERDRRKRATADEP